MKSASVNFFDGRTVSIKNFQNQFHFPGVYFYISFLQLQVKFYRWRPGAKYRNESSVY